MIPASLRPRSGLQLARLNRRTKQQNRAEVINAGLLVVSIVLVLAVYVFVCAIVGR